MPTSSKGSGVIPVECKYIYGIIEDSEEKVFNSEVHTIPYQDISAVVSDSSFVDYTTLPKDQVAKFLLTHQQVIEKVMDSYTIIPMKLGTYAFNIREIEEILSKGYA
ncbi:MAG: GvpL/GvpF family gas vesicle protein, partial [Nitrospirota bacterium]|nr:GvpL/GvpF family gas vesicle protein [Nitrospirota bacterium]